MKNNIYVVIYFAISLLLSAFYFYITLNLILTVILFLISLLLQITLIYKKQIAAKFRFSRTRECITFINNFIITLSIKRNTKSALDSVSESFSPLLKEQYDLINHLNSDEKIEYLLNYFKADIYKVFLKIIDQYNYNGGDIINISQLLMYDSRKIEESILDYSTIANRKMIEFISLWGLTFAILFIMKIALGDFFLNIMRMDFFPISIFAFNLLFLLSYYLFMNKYCNYNFIKGEFKDEKIKRKNKKLKSRL